MHIGLIGGIGPGATDFYYRRLISTFARRNAALELTIVHADAPTLVSNLANDNTAAQTAIYLQLTKRLAAAGAECVGITSIGGHFCIAEFQAESPLPVVDLLSEVNRAIQVRGFKRIGVLGTRTVMGSRCYGRIAGAEVMPPSGRGLDDVHEAYVSMAVSGVVTAEQRAVFDAAIYRLLKEQGAEAILLGGTDLALAFSEETAWFPVIDGAAIHADAMAALAIG